MSESPPLVSVVSPVYLAATIVEELVTRIRAALVGTGTYEIVLVDDRSPDNSWTEICRMSEQFVEVRGIRLSRNFGQHAAISAGLDHSRGEFVVVMDCDLQDDPSRIPEMLDLAQKGADVVLTYRTQRRHSFFRNTAARVYNRALAIFSGNDPSKVGQGSFSLLRRKVVDALNDLADVHQHYLSALQYLGFEQVTIEVSHSPRFDGKSSYSFRKLVRHAVDGMVSQSLRMLYVAVSVGFGLFAVSIVGIIYLLVNYFVRGALAGFTSLAVIVLLTSGVVLMSLGVVGVYVGRVFEQVKASSRYVVDTVVGQGRQAEAVRDGEGVRRDGR